MKEQMRERRKNIKKEASRVGWGLILYTILSFCFIMSSFIAAGIYLESQYPGVTEQDAVYTEVMLKCENSGTFSVIGVCIGVLFLFCFFRKKITASSIIYSEKKMSAITFMQVFCVFMGNQILFNILGNFLESGLNLIGYSAVESMETASSVSTTVSMFIYASVVAPIVEEVVYRGFVLRSFQKYGKVAAVILSSVLFGVMYANVPQGIFAFGVGLVLGYVTVEYSIVWAIALHFINNCFFGDVWGWAVAGLSEKMQENIFIGTYVVLGIAAVIVLWKKRRVIQTFFQENRTEKKVYRYIFSAGGIALFIVGEVFCAVMMLQKL